ncbi:stromal membrane-associated protein 1 isoform X2 [Ictalurus punctatus]|uniref:Stromal membrane-associated protein 1 isoform X2 n=1 Tax=Ictalurus punctatus TaxID=7998 RepID=A0A2D0QMM0_ICTPU|nr:stromal membrane-associated protein 1 isoform X2 [Ictalurus punctatus]
MTTRSEREKAQKLNEQHQAILSKMLREDDNKYCADCEAKGPRWASWNLGVFICIRCAGIHRNLGVHISRVKSVNLDQWTPEQIQSVQSMGNTKARQLYEAHLPDNFRRPQTDQAVEFFIRDKYEKKKYYDKNAVTDSFKEREKKKEEKKKEKETDKGNKPTVFDKKREDIQIDSRASPKKSAEPAIDLLGLDAPAVNTSSSGAGSGSAASISDDLDIFGPMVSNPLPSSTNTNQVNSTKAAGSTPAGPGVGATSGAVGTAGAAPVQSDLDLFSENSSNKAEESTKKPLSKDSILSLYGSSTVPQQPAPAAMFIGTSQMPFPAQPQANFQAFPAMGGPMPPTTMMGAVMGQGGAMMGQNTGMMVGMTMPNGFMGNAPAGVMGVAPGMMGAQAGAMPAGVVPPQNMYTMQPGQQTQWSVGQMNQQMSGLNLNGAPMAFGQPGTAMGGWVGPPSGQTLSTQLWK